MKKVLKYYVFLWQCMEQNHVVFDIEKQFIWQNLKWWRMQKILKWLCRSKTDSRIGVSHKHVVTQEAVRTQGGGNALPGSHSCALGMCSLATVTDTFYATLGQVL